MVKNKNIKKYKKIKFAIRAGNIQRLQQAGVGINLLTFNLINRAAFYIDCQICYQVCSPYHSQLNSAIDVCTNL